MNEVTRSDEMEHFAVVAVRYLLHWQRAGAFYQNIRLFSSNSNVQLPNAIVGRATFSSSFLPTVTRKISVIAYLCGRCREDLVLGCTTT